MLSRLRGASGDLQVVKLPRPVDGKTAKEIAKLLQASPDVVFVQPDEFARPALVPNDPLYLQQWHYYEDSGGIRLPGAWDVTTGSANVVVAVIDTGVLSNHADFAGRILPGYDFINDARIANDGDGRDGNANDPGDWVTPAENSSGFFQGCGASNSVWHGSHVAGTIGAASNNGIGVTGVNWTSKILPVRVLGKCGGYLSDIIDGMRWAAGLPVPGAPANPNPAQVLNLSLGASIACGIAEQTAINDIVAAGKVIVVAAGNGNTDAANTSPASCNNVIAVAATTRSGGRAYYSNYGSVVDISAPGGAQSFYNDPNGIDSILNTGTTSPAADSYRFYQGTSMATAHITGVVSLMLSVKPTLTPQQVLEKLQATARAFPDPSCNAQLCGPGIVNASAAVRNGANQRPIVSAGPSIRVNPAVVVRLNGTATDDGAIVKYVWRQLSGPAAVLQGFNTPSLQFTAPRALGNMVFQLTVTDDGGLTASNAATVTLNNVAPVFGPIANKSVAYGSTLNFKVTASDANGTLPRLGAIGLPTGASFNAANGVFYWPKIRTRGSFTVTFTATDGVSMRRRVITIRVY
ncbi:MAG TPA: S8 family serine peptidase [Gammaproteobacteria bacterium]|nr:S8 family serine peptidase [Gammaproteobacteria bacterium]